MYRCCPYDLIRLIDRGWKYGQESSTDDTGEDDDVGGLGKFSHGSICLSHQHWVEQVISAGSFGVHCTEAAEAKHKTCMRLASQRVRHFRENLTQKSMLNYLRRHSVFESMVQLQTPTPVTNKRRCPEGVSVQLPLRCLMGQDLESVQRQQQFIHAEVRLARVELLDLLCDRLGLAKTRRTYSCMNGLQWDFGQKLVSPRSTYWSTDTQYSCPTSETRFFLMHIYLCPYVS